MIYVLMASGAALVAVTLLAWRDRFPLVLLRRSLAALFLGVALWLVYEMSQLPTWDNYQLRVIVH